MIELPVCQGKRRTSQNKQNRTEQSERLSLAAICRNMKITFNVKRQTVEKGRGKEEKGALFFHRQAEFSRCHLDRPERKADSWRATSSILFLLHAFIFLFCVYIKVKWGRLRSSALISAPGQDSRTKGHRDCWGCWDCTQKNALTWLN